MSAIELDDALVSKDSQAMLILGEQQPALAVSWNGNSLAKHACCNFNGLLVNVDRAPLKKCVNLSSVEIPRWLCACWLLFARRTVLGRRRGVVQVEVILPSLQKLVLVLN